MHKNRAHLFLAIILTFFAGAFFTASPVQAAVCSITTNTLINQAYVDSNSCDSIEINANVASTTWSGTVDLQGSGTVTVKSGYTMTMGSSSAMILGADDDFTVEANATATHLLEDVYGLRISARNITISGTLSGSERGCRRSGQYGDDGYGVNVSTGVCGYQAGGYGRGGGGSGAGGGGGSHAGIGGRAGGVAGGSILYGDGLFPSTLGSGGGTGYYATAYGGAGGGIIQVTSTGVLTVNGTIQANGGAGNPTDTGYNGGGGGAGGSVSVSAATLAGSGTISANGGTGGAPTGGGGGAGRVAVRYDSLTTFTLSNITATKGSGGSGGVAGGVGTTYILDRVTDDGAGTLTVTSGFNFPSQGDYTRTSINISSGAVLSCIEATSLNVSAVNWFTLADVIWNCSATTTSVSISSSAGISTTNTTLTFSAASSVAITAPSWTNVTTTINVTQPGASSTWDIASDLTLRGMVYTGGHAATNSAQGGWLSIKNSIGLSLVSSTLAASVSSTQLTSLSIDSLSTINATGKGCSGGIEADDGFGPASVSKICGRAVSGYGLAGNGGGGGGGGAAHAGTGGAGNGGGAAQATTYGSSTHPLLFGSGGGGGYWGGSAPGGAGGGIVYIRTSGALTVDGSIRANGANGTYGGSYNGGGGGSGGSIYLYAGTLAGSGTISANGGTGASTGGGGGGGGRIAILYSALTFNGSSSTSLGAGGTSAGNGTAGTVYDFQMNVAPDSPTSLGPTALVNGSSTGTANPIFSFTLSDPDVDTVKYRIQIDDSSDFSSPVVDYTSALSAEGARSFQVGQATGSGAYTVGSSGQTLSSGSYYWRVKTIDAAAAESSYATANGGAIAFVLDATPRYLSFLNSTESGLESVTATSVRIMLSGGAYFEDITVSYGASDGSTDGSVDYVVTSTTATIAAGETSVTIPITIFEDDIDEANESFSITLSNPTAGSIGSNTSTTYTITDNDTAAASITPTALQITETESASYAIVLGTPPTTTVQVVLTPGYGLSLSTSTLTFTSSTWNQSRTITVTTLDDSLLTANRNVVVTQTVSTTAIGYAGMSLPITSVIIVERGVSGGGGGGGVSGVVGSVPTPVVAGTSASSTSATSSTGQIPPVVTQQIPAEPPVQATTTTPNVASPAPATEESAPTIQAPTQEIIQILNPGDLTTLIEATGRPRDRAAENRALRLLRQDIQEFRVKATSQELASLANFIAYGISETTRKLGFGERRALIRDMLETMRTAAVHPADIERLTRGMAPSNRNLNAEKTQLSRARSTFRTIYGRLPNFEEPEESLAWNTLVYRIRFERDLSLERKGITAFRKIFRRDPRDSFQWAVVRVLGYVKR